MGRWTDRIGQGAGCIGGGALLALHLVWGIVRFFAIAGLLNRWFGTQYWPGAICAGIIAEVPIISEVLAVWGGIVHYGLAWQYSTLIFAPEATIGLGILPIAIIISMIRTISRPWRVLLLAATTIAVGLWFASRRSTSANDQEAGLDYHQFGHVYHAKVVSPSELLIEMPYCVCDLQTGRLLDIQSATLVLRSADEIIDFANALQSLKHRHSLAVANNDSDIDYALPHDWHIVVGDRETVVEPHARIVRYVDGNLEPAGRTWGFMAVDTNNTALIGLTFYDRKDNDWTADYNQFVAFVATCAQRAIAETASTNLLQSARKNRLP